VNSWERREDVATAVLTDLGLLRRVSFTVEAQLFYRKVDQLNILVNLLQ